MYGARRQNRVVEWISGGAPEVQKQRGKWVVRQSGYDPATGLRKVRQLATFRTKREATAYRAEVLAGWAGTATETVAQFLQQVWLPSKQGRIETPTPWTGPCGRAGPRWRPVAACRPC